MKKFLTMALALMMVLSLFAVPTMAADDGVVFYDDFEDYTNNGGTKQTSIWDRFTDFSTGYGDTGYALRMKMETSHQTNGLAQKYKSYITIPAGDYTFSAKVKGTPGMANKSFDGLTAKIQLFPSNASKAVNGTPVPLTKEWQTISLDFSLATDFTAVLPTFQIWFQGGPAESSVYVSFDDITIAEKADEPVLPTTATVSISGANAVTSVANETVTIGEKTTYTVTPKLGYYITGITVDGEPYYTGFDAYKGGTYDTDAINADTEIVVTTAAIDTDASGAYSTDVATLPAAFATTASTVTFGKVLDANATSWGVKLTQNGEGVLTYHGGGPLYKADRKTADGQYAVEFVGLAAGTYTVETYVIVDGVKTFGAPTTFTVVE